MGKRKSKTQKKVEKVMSEFKKGELSIGESNKKVKSREQAIAIAMSESGQSQVKKKPMRKRVKKKSVSIKSKKKSAVKKK